MSNVDTAQDQAVLWALDFDAELPCESKHSAPNPTPCGGVATHIAHSCTRSNFLICKPLVEVFAKRQNFICAGCEKNAEECWSIRPI